VAKNAPDFTDLHLDFKNIPGVMPPNPLGWLAPVVLAERLIQRIFLIKYFLQFI